MCFTNLPSDVIDRDFLGGGRGLGLGEDERKHKEKCLSTPDRLLCDESFLDENISYIENLRRARLKSRNKQCDGKTKILIVTDEFSPALNLQKKPLQMTSSKIWEEQE